MTNRAASINLWEQTPSKFGHGCKARAVECAPPAQPLATRTCHSESSNPSALHGTNMSNEEKWLMTHTMYHNLTDNMKS